MWVGDSLQWHAWYADAWLTATARMACGRADSLQWHARYAGAWLTAMVRTVCGRMTHCNGTQGMRVGDSPEMVR